MTPLTHHGCSTPRSSQPPWWPLLLLVALMGLIGDCRVSPCASQLFRSSMVVLTPRSRRVFVTVDVSDPLLCLSSRTGRLVASVRTITANETHHGPANWRLRGTTLRLQWMWPNWEGDQQSAHLDLVHAFSPSSLSCEGHSSEENDAGWRAASDPLFVVDGHPLSLDVGADESSRMGIASPYRASPDERRVVDVRVEPNQEEEARQHGDVFGQAAWPARMVLAITLCHQTASPLLGELALFFQIAIVGGDDHFAHPPHVMAHAAMPLDAEGGDEGVTTMTTDSPRRLWMRQRRQSNNSAADLNLSSSNTSHQPSSSPSILIMVEGHNGTTITALIRTTAPTMATSSSATTTTNSDVPLPLNTTTTPPPVAVSENSQFILYSATTVFAVSYLLIAVGWAGFVIFQTWRERRVDRRVVVASGVTPARGGHRVAFKRRYSRLCLMMWIAPIVVALHKALTAAIQAGRHFASSSQVQTVDVTLSSAALVAKLTSGLSMSALTLFLGTGIGLTRPNVRLMERNIIAGSLAFQCVFKSLQLSCVYGLITDGCSSHEVSGTVTALLVKCVACGLLSYQMETVLAVLSTADTLADANGGVPAPDEGTPGAGGGSPGTPTVPLNNTVQYCSVATLLVLMRFRVPYYAHAALPIVGSFVITSIRSLDAVANGAMSLVLDDVVDVYTLLCITILFFMRLTPISLSVDGAATLAGQSGPGAPGLWPTEDTDDECISDAE